MTRVHQMAGWVFPQSFTDTMEQLYPDVLDGIVPRITHVFPLLTDEKQNTSKSSKRVAGRETLLAISCEKVIATQHISTQKEKMGLLGEY